MKRLFWIWSICFGIGMQFFIFYKYITLDTKNIAYKTDIKKCFEGVDWRYQVILVNGEEVKDSEGNAQFYKTKTIDDAIEKLNKILE